MINEMLALYTFTYIQYKIYLFQLDCEASSENSFKSLLSPLPGTNHWCHMRNHGRDPCGVQTHYPLGCEADTLMIQPLPLA